MSDDRKSEIPAGGYSICEHGIPSYGSTPCSRCGGFVAGEASGAGDLCLCEEQSSGTDLIAAERQRQVDREGWTPEHDDTHSAGQLAWAAVCYAAPDRVYVERHGTDYRQFVDPWPVSWFVRDLADRGGSDGDKRKQQANYVRMPPPGDRLDYLVKAGALIAAEIDRLQRAALTVPRAGGEAMSDDPKSMQFNGLTSYLAICEWARPFAGDPDRNTLSLAELFRFQGGKRPLMLVRGREGVMAANPGDWVVRDDKYEFSVRAVDLAALREAAQAVVEFRDDFVAACQKGGLSGVLIREQEAWDALRAVLASADSESREETP